MNFFFGWKLFNVCTHLNRLLWNVSNASSVRQHANVESAVFFLKRLVFVYFFLLNETMTENPDNQAEEIEEECCNSGCNNCVLDVRQRQREKHLKLSKQQKNNLFDGVYRKYKLIWIGNCTENVRHYRFEYQPNEETSTALEKYTIFAPPAHYAMLRAPSTVGSDSKHDKSMSENYLSRPYTPIQFDDTQLTFDVLVKFEPNGLMSEYLQSLELNSVTEWKGSYGDFIWTPNPKKYKYLVCICQGVAIAPHFALISSILANENDETIVYLLACFKNLQNCLLREELAECRKYWNFNAIFYLSQHPNCDQCAKEKTENCQCIRSSLKYGETVRTHRLDVSKITNFYRERNTNLIFTLVCGTNRLESLVSDAIDELNDNTLKENYFCLK